MRRLIALLLGLGSGFGTLSSSFADPDLSLLGPYRFCMVPSAVDSPYVRKIDSRYAVVVPLYIRNLCGVDLNTEATITLMDGTRTAIRGVNIASDPSFTVVSGKGVTHKVVFDIPNVDDLEDVRGDVGGVTMSLVMRPDVTKPENWSYSNQTVVFSPLQAAAISATIVDETPLRNAGDPLLGKKGASVMGGSDPNRLGAFASTPSSPTMGGISYGH